jgi:hypothetical protein
MTRLSDSKISLSDLFVETELKFSLNPGTGLNIYKHLVYWKHIKADVSKTIDFADLER